MTSVRLNGLRPILATDTAKPAAATPVAPKATPVSSAPVSGLASLLNPAAYDVRAKEIASLGEAMSATSNLGLSLLLLHSVGPANLEEVVSGRLVRRNENGRTQAYLVPNGDKRRAFRLSAGDCEGVPEGAPVTIRRSGRGANQALSIDAAKTPVVKSFVGVAEAQADGSIAAIARDPTAAIRKLPLPGASPSIAGRTVLAHVHEALKSQRFGVVEELLPENDPWRVTWTEIAVKHGVEATFSLEEKAEAARLASAFAASKLEGYADWTDRPFISVSGGAGKGADHAFSVTPHPTVNGGHEVTVCLPDPRYLLRLLGPQSALEQRATRMLTSVSLPQASFPLFPPELAEELATFAVGERRPALAVTFSLDADGRVVGAPTFSDVLVRATEDVAVNDAQRHYVGQKVFAPETASILDRLRRAGGALIGQAVRRSRMEGLDPENDVTSPAANKSQPFAERATGEVVRKAAELVHAALAAGDVPVLHRVRAPADAERIAAARRAAMLLGCPWPEGETSAEVLRKLDPQAPAARAIRRLVLRAQQPDDISAAVGAADAAQRVKDREPLAPLERFADVLNLDALRALRDEATRHPAVVARMVESARAARDRGRAIEREVRPRLAALALAPFEGTDVKGEVIGVSPGGVEVYVEGAKVEVTIPMSGYMLDTSGLTLRTQDGSSRFTLGDEVTLRVGKVQPHQGAMALSLDPVSRTRRIAPAPQAAQVSEVKSLAEVRGDGFTSKLVGQRVTTRGVVTAVNGVGFFIQPKGEKDAGGLLVRVNGVPVQVGDEVEVKGLVAEHRDPLAPLDRSVVEILGRPRVRIIAEGQPIPDAVAIGGAAGLPPPGNDPKKATEYWRKLLGQRVRIAAGTAISPSNRFGDLVVMPDGWKTEQHPRTPEGGVLYRPGPENLAKIGIKYRPHVGAIPPTSVGARVEDVEGVVIYRSGEFQIELAKSAKITPPPAPEPHVTRLTADLEHMVVASLNCLNLHPGELERAKRLASRIVECMRSPDIIALQEIQDNDGPIESPITAADQTYAMLVKLIEEAGGPKYEWIDIPPVNGADGGQPGGNIRCGYLYRADRVKLDPTSVQRIGEGDPAFDGTRKPLVARFTFEGRELLMVNRHASSRRGSTPWTSEHPMVIGGEEKRVAQATAEKAFIDRLVAGAKAKGSEPDVLVVGDYNDFPGTPSVKTLGSGGLVELSDLVPPEDRYDYNFRGTLQMLCPVVGSERLVREQRVEIEWLHSNSVNPLDDSDHDHVVVRIAK